MFPKWLSLKANNTKSNVFILGTTKEKKKRGKEYAPIWGKEYPFYLP